MNLQVEYVDRDEAGRGRSVPAVPTGPTTYMYDHRPRPSPSGGASTSALGPSYRVDLDELNGEDYSYYQSVKYHWLYSSQSYGWWHFSQEDNEALEKAYQSGKSETELAIGGNQFHFDFDKMIQRSRGRSTRNVLRVKELFDIALRGIAGTRIDKDTVTGVI